MGGKGNVKNLKSNLACKQSLKIPQPLFVLSTLIAKHHAAGLICYYVICIVLSCTMICILISQTYRHKLYTAEYPHSICNASIRLILRKALSKLHRHE